MAVIEFSHVSKEYRLGCRVNLRGAITQVAKNLMRPGKTDRSMFSALTDVSFQVRQGEVLGIIGHNGAGKSTILKLLSRVSYPTRGTIHTQGRLAALIELGAGFHPDLTGRENIYLNGSILGLRKREIDEQMSNMVEFAGLQQFIDTPVKRYSSGMYVRLAFAVAAHVKADLLLVDEVLSVGDMAFQQKSLAKMNELRDSGATIVFVSHNLPALQTFTNRVLLLDNGRIVAEGDPGEVIEKYRIGEQEKRNLALAKLKAQDAEIIQSLDEKSNPDIPFVTSLELLDSNQQPKPDFDANEGFTVRCRFVIPTAMEFPMCVVRIRRRVDGLNCVRFYQYHPSQPSLQGEGIFQVSVPELLLVPGAYMLEAFIHNDHSPRHIAVSPPKNFYITGRLRTEGSAVFQPHAEWSFGSEHSMLLDSSAVTASR